MVTSVVMSHSNFYLMLTLLARFLIATVGRQIPCILYVLSNGDLELWKNLWISTAECFETGN